MIFLMWYTNEHKDKKILYMKYNYNMTMDERRVSGSRPDWLVQCLTYEWAGLD